MHMSTGLALENTGCLIKIIHLSNQKVTFVLSVFHSIAKENCLMGLWERGSRGRHPGFSESGSTQGRKIDAMEGFFKPRESLKMGKNSQREERVQLMEKELCLEYIKTYCSG